MLVVYVATIYLDTDKVGPGIEKTSYGKDKLLGTCSSHSSLHRLLKSLDFGYVLGDHLLVEDLEKWGAKPEGSHCTSDRVFEDGDGLHGQPNWIKPFGKVPLQV